MYGTNKIASPRTEAGYLVHSIFPTIQGEGPDAGQPAIFVRLTGCNLRCFYCDTEFEEGGVCTQDDIVSMITEMTKRESLVVFTGGEPLLQDIGPVILALNRAGWRCAVETAGTALYAENVELFMALFLRDALTQKTLNTLVCSPKTPRLNPHIVPIVSCFKYILRAGEVSQDDGLPVMSTQLRNQPSAIYRPFDLEMLMKLGRIFVQPCDDHDPVRNHENMQTAVWSAQEFGYRLSLQTHKIAGLA